MSAKEQFFSRFDDHEDETRRQAARAEEIRQGLIGRAREVVTVWEGQKFFFEETAIRKASQVILPWWHEIERRLPMVNRKSYRKHLYGPVTYDYPDLCLKQLALLSQPKSAHLPFSNTAKLLAVNPQQEIDERKVFGIGQKRQANLFVIEHQHRLNLSFEPVPEPRPTGMAGGYLIQSLKRLIDLGSPESLINSVEHPATVIGLASVIETGEVWDKLMR